MTYPKILWKLWQDIWFRLGCISIACNTPDCAHNWIKPFKRFKLHLECRQLGCDSDCNPYRISVDAKGDEDGL